MHQRLTFGPGDRDPIAVPVDRRVVGVVVGGVSEHRAIDRLDIVVVPGPIPRRAQEHEVAVREPVEDRVEVTELVHPVAHRFEGIHRGVDTADRSGEIGLQARCALVVETVEFDVGPRLDLAAAVPVVGLDGNDAIICVALDAQHRMDHEVGRDTVPLDHHADGVDEERRIVGHEEQHRPIGEPAVTFPIGHEHPNRRASGGPTRAEPVMRQGHRIQVVGRPPVEIEIG